MLYLNIDHLRRCMQTLASSLTLYRKAEPDSIDQEVFRNAIGKSYELTQETAFKLLKKALEVWAYGSRVNGDYYDASDLDLVLRQPDDLHCRQKNLDDIIEAFSESNLPILVQVLDWAAIPDAFHEEILENYVVVQGGARLIKS